MAYEVVIGIEIHAELKTKGKLFSSGLNIYGAAVNEKTSAYDTAQPGTLPILNKECLELALMASLALECDIARYMEFDRKNYYYPDNPKGYQITQDRTPIGTKGSVTFDVDGVSKTVEITRLHIEEDTAKSIHLGDDTLLDFNRCGSPLIEIVSDASMRSPREAGRYIETLRSILLFAGVSDVRMEEGSMRCDANVSVREFGQEEFGTKVEIKNLNSISKLEKSLIYEVERQSNLIDNGGVVIQETRRFDDVTGETVVMRIKETADDYRYHYDSNIPPITLDESYILEVKSKLPELPKAKVSRYLNEYGIDLYSANVLTQTIELSELFDECVKLGASAKTVANFIMGDLSGYMNKNKVDLSEIHITSKNLVDICELFVADTISSKIAKNILIEAIENEIDVNKYVDENSLVQISDDSELVAIVKEVLASNDQSVQDYISGNEYAFKFLMGQVMKATKGKANPKKVTDIIKTELK